MKNNDFKEVLNKCFGKEKDDKYHALAMLAIYGIFILIVIIMIRLGGSSSNIENNNTNPTPTPSQTISPTPTNDVDIEDNTTITNDINYSYSYTVSYNGTTEVYLGKKIDEKEKFTLIKDGITTNYAILSDNFLILENDIYHITENPSKFFKYCDVEKVLLLIENEISTENGNTIKYNITNSHLASSFKDNIKLNNEQTNLIIITTENNNLKSVDLELNNYISSVEGSTNTLTIHMEFANIGTTEDFEIKVS